MPSDDANLACSGAPHPELDTRALLENLLSDDWRSRGYAVTANALPGA